MNTHTETADPDVMKTRYEAKPKRISDAARWTYGLLAFLSPISLLVLLGLVGMHAASGSEQMPGLAIVVGIYQFLGTVMLVMFFGRDMVSQRGLSTIARRTWAASFVFAAPVALPVYWLAYLRPDPGVKQARRLESDESEIVVTSLPSLATA